MMPSSRVEIWVAYRDARGDLTASPPGATATLLDSGYNTGPAGDTWPAVNLAEVDFIPVGAAHPPRALTTRETPLTIADPLEITQDANQDNTTATITPDQGVTPWKCVPLPKGHRRRIYFNVATDYPDLFGLGHRGSLFRWRMSAASLCAASCNGREGQGQHGRCRRRPRKTCAATRTRQTPAVAVDLGGRRPSRRRADYFARGDDWFDVYKALECLEMRFGDEEEFRSLGWADKGKIKLLKRTANSGRHARKKFDPPPHPMERTEARDLLAKLMACAFLEAPATQPPL
jgi:hypothetical protein